MYLCKVFLFLQTVFIVFARPQFITFKDGNVGVNFGGYHAEAGLGGLLNGNNQAGGLFASAGTPHGQFAGAGLGGSVNGNNHGGARGGAFAVATANKDIQTYAGIHGRIGENDHEHENDNKQETSSVKNTQNISKIKTKSSKDEIRTKAVHIESHPSTKNRNNYNEIPETRNGFFNDIFNIPIATLSAVNQFLNNNIRKY